MPRGSSRRHRADADVLYYPSSQGTLERDDWERLPLHYAVLGNAPPAVVAALAKAYPEAVVAKDDIGEDTPLDLARKNRSSAEVLATLEWAAEQAAGSACVPFQLSDTQTSTWTVSEEDESQPYSPTNERVQRGFLPPLVEGSTEKPSEGRSSVGDSIQPTPAASEVASSPGGFLPMRDLASQLTSPPVSDLDGVRRSLSTEGSLDLRTEPSIDGHYYDSATSSQLAATFHEHHSPPPPPPPPWDVNCPPLDLLPPFTPPPPQNPPPGTLGREHPPRTPPLMGTLGRESGGGGGRCSTGGLATGSSAGGTWTHATSPPPPMPTSPLPSSRQEKPAAPSVVARPAAYTDLAVETLARRKEAADAADAADAAAVRVAAAAVASARVMAAAVAAEAAAETLEEAAEELAAAEAAAAAAEASPSLKRKPSPAGPVLSPLAKRQSPLHAAASAPAIPDFPFGLLPSAAGVPLANPSADADADAQAHAHAHAARQPAPAPRSYDDVARETAVARARRSSESREQLAELRASMVIEQEQAAEAEARAAAAASARRASLRREQVEEERTLAQLAGGAPQPTPPSPPPLASIGTSDAPVSPTTRDSLSPMRTGLKQPASPSSPDRAAAELAKIERAHVAARMDAAKQHLAESAAAKERLAALLANRPQSMGSSTSVYIPPAAAPIAPISAVEISDSEKQAFGPSAEAVQAQHDWLRAEVARSISPTATAAAAGQQAGAATGAATGVAVANGVGGAPVAAPAAAAPARATPTGFEKQMTGLEKQMHQGLEAAKVAGEKLMKEVESVACIMPCVSPRSQRPTGARPSPTPIPPTAPAAPIGAA